MMEQTPFFMNYSFHPRSPTTSLTRDITKVQSLEEWLAELDAMLAITYDKVKEAQESAQFYADQHRRDLYFKVGEKVYLST